MAGPEGEEEERPPLEAEAAADADATAAAQASETESEEEGEEESTEEDEEGSEASSGSSDSGEGSGSDSEEDQGEEVEEEMPILKYHRMKAHVQAVLGPSPSPSSTTPTPALDTTVEVTAVCLHPRCLIVGTSAGSVHLLDYQGGSQELARVPAHRAAAGVGKGAAVAVRCISIDDSGEFVASCSDAGTVVVFPVAFAANAGGSTTSTSTTAAATNTPATTMTGGAAAAAAARSSSSSSSSSSTSALTAATGLASTTVGGGSSSTGGGGGGGGGGSSGAKTVTVPGVTVGAEQTFRFTWKGGAPQPLHTVHVDPAYRRRTEKAFVCGGEAGQLVVARKGFFSYREEVLHEGEGPVCALAWRGSLLAWANDEGVKVLDVESEERISFVERPEVEGRVSALRCSLLWESDTSLLIGWYDTVLLLQIKPRGDVSGAASASPARVVQQPTRLGEITLRWRTDCVISGLYPFDADSVAVLGYVSVLEDSEDEEEAEDASVPASASGAGAVVCRAELQLRARRDGRLFSAEVLPLEGDDRVRDSRGYLLASSVALTCKKAPGPGLWRLPRGLVAGQPQQQPQPASASHQHPSGGGAALSTSAAAISTAGESFAPVMLVASPRDLLVARVRTVDDRILWELRRGDLAAAIQLALLNRHLLTQQRFHALATAYLEQLMERGDYARAAAECPRLLGDDSALWERWIYSFASKGQLAALAPFVPLQHPRLSRSTYEMVLYNFLDRKEHAALLATLRRWGSSRHLQPPPGRFGAPLQQVYDVGEAARRVAAAAATSPDPTLYEALALLHQLQGRFEAALMVYWDLFRLGSAEEPHSQERAALFAPVFRLIEEHGLFDAAASKVPVLLRMDREAAGELLLRYVDRFPVAAVVRQLQQEESGGQEAGAPPGGSPMKKPPGSASLTPSPQKSSKRGAAGRVGPGPAAGKQSPARASGGVGAGGDVGASSSSSSSALLLWYLHLLFTRLPEQYNAPEHRELHRLQVDLYAAAAPPFRPVAEWEEEEEGEYRSDLLAFLQWSNHVELETALAACERRAPPLYDEVVYILGRIGHTKEALAILLEKIGSVSRAIDFVERHDKALWRDLTAFSLRHPRFLAGLLRHAGEYNVDLARDLLRDIPDGMAIPGLRKKLLGIVASYRFERTLHEGCQAVTSRDWVAATRRFHHAQRRAVRVDVPQAPCHGCGAPLAGAGPPFPPPHLPARAEESLAPTGRHVFACRHAYHDPCCWAVERPPPPLLATGAESRAQYAFRCEACRNEAFYALSSSGPTKAGEGVGGGRR